VLFIKIGVGLV